MSPNHDPSQGGPGCPASRLIAFRPAVWKAALVCMILAALTSPLRGEESDKVNQLARVLSVADDYKARLAAVLGLARTKDSRAVPPLILALKDSHHMVRGAAAGALGTLGDQRARPPLEVLVQGDKEDFVRAQAQKALAILMAAQEDSKKPSAGSGMELLGSLGTLGQHAIRQGLYAPTRKAAICLGRQLGKAPFLGGDISLKFRITEEGKVKWVHVLSSDLGSLEVERCMMAEMAAAAFDKPEGGEAEFTVPLAFGGAQAMMVLDPQVSAAAQSLQRQCNALLITEEESVLLKPPEGLVLALYIDREGAVVSAGMSAGGAEIPEPMADRLVANLKALKLKEPDLQGTHGKLIHRFNCKPEAMPKKSKTRSKSRTKTKRSTKKKKR